MRACFGDGWARKLCQLLGYEARHAYRLSSGENVPRRRPLLMLQHHARQKRGARAARLARAIERAKKEVRIEDAALDALITWCESELAKKK